MKKLHTFRFHKYEDDNPLEYMGESNTTRQCYEACIEVDENGNKISGVTGERVTGMQTPIGTPFYYCFNTFEVYAVWEDELSYEEKQVIENFDLCL